MNDSPHRNLQNLPKIGSVFSDKDEKQRQIAEEIMQYRIRPEMKMKINMNIKGLDKKTQITPVNPETMRWFGRISSKGRVGWVYANLMTNHFRFIPIAFYATFYYYQGYRLVSANYYDQYENNNEWEAIYMKMQTFPGHYCDIWSFMA